MNSFRGIRRLVAATSLPSSRRFAGTSSPRQRIPIFGPGSNTEPSAAPETRLGQYEIVDSCPEPDFDTGCTFCQPEFPPDLQVKSGAPLAGTAPSVGRHLLVSTGHSEWPNKTELDPASLEAKLRDLQRTGGIRRDPDFNYLVTSTDLAPPEDKDSWSIHMYPDNLYFPRVPFAKADAFMKRYLVPSRAQEAEGFEEEVEVRKAENPIIAICGHTSRDMRCGIVGPMLKAEFEQVLGAKGLLYDSTTDKGVKVAIVSHVGGHVYAGNVIIFDGRGNSIWYGLVQPKHVQGIVKQTIERKQIIRPLYRGGTILD
ncbi:actin patches distal protein 1 [Myxozyma melibiosi]|uniref:Altered inheritance of mitochondria protein 32 n=1 Tax=Myxozyma melibiosi TaxID=54550 RepID=A0ABR1FBB0_9ASCO